MQIVIIGSCARLIVMVGLVDFDAAAKICFIVLAEVVFREQVMVIFVFSLSFELFSLFSPFIVLLSQWITLNVGVDALRLVGFLALIAEIYIIERTWFIVTLFVFVFLIVILILLKIVLLINLSFNIPALFHYPLIRIRLIGCVCVVSNIQQLITHTITTDDLMSHTIFITWYLLFWYVVLITIFAFSLRYFAHRFSWFCFLFLTYLLLEVSFCVVYFVLGNVFQRLYYWLSLCLWYNIRLHSHSYCLLSAEFSTTPSMLQ